MNKKQALYLLVLLLSAVLLSSCSNFEQHDVSGITQKALEPNEITEIKSLKTAENSDICLDDLIVAGLGSPTYETIVSNVDNCTYVTISGDINYSGVPAVAKLQYKRKSSNNYELQSLTLNDLPMDETVTKDIFTYLYGQYYSNMFNPSDKASGNEFSLECMRHHFNVGLLDIGKMYGSDFKNTRHSGGEFMVYDDIAFGFDGMNLSEHANPVSIIIKSEDVSIFGIQVGMTASEAKESCPFQIDTYYDNEMTFEYYHTIYCEEFMIEFCTSDTDSEITSIEIKPNQY